MLVLGATSTYFEKHTFFFLDGCESDDDDDEVCVENFNEECSILLIVGCCFDNGVVLLISIATSGAIKGEAPLSVSEVVLSQHSSSCCDNNLLME